VTFLLDSVYQKLLKLVNFNWAILKNQGGLVFWSTLYCVTTPPPQLFKALFPGPPGWAGARRELLDFMVQWKINRGYTDHLAGRHSIRTNQCQPPPSAHFFTGRMRFLPPNQQCQSTLYCVRKFKCSYASMWSLNLSLCCVSLPSPSLPLLPASAHPLAVFPLPRPLAGFIWYISPMYAINITYVKVSLTCFLIILQIF